jgi:hypothetical protein
VAKRRTNIMLERDKAEKAAVVLGTQGLSETVDAALERVLSDDALGRLAGDAYDFSPLAVDLKRVRSPRAISPDAG